MRLSLRNRLFFQAESLGLSPNEARIYEALVEHGESGVSEIALFGNIHRRNAYDAIHRLVEKGLCFPILSAGENIAYAPTTALANDGLINSPEHRDNILSKDFNKIGVGVIDAGTYGKMFTQDFTN